MDFDDAAIHARFLELIAACGASALLESLVYEETPGRGRHYGYLCVEWGASTILARRPRGLDAHGREQFDTLIESKGEGGQGVVAPTPAGIHPDYPDAGVYPGPGGLDGDAADHPEGPARAVGLCTGAG